MMYFWYSWGILLCPDKCHIPKSAKHIHLGFIFLFIKKVKIHLLVANGFEQNFFGIHRSLLIGSQYLLDLIS